MRRLEQDVIEIRNPVGKSFVERFKTVGMLIPYFAENVSEPEPIRREVDTGSSRDRLGDAVCVEQEQAASS